MNHKSLIISIILVVYNRVKVVESMIKSVCMQTYPNIDFIIIDGGSTDGTVDIIKKYQDRISYWVSEPDNGIYDAFRKGIAASKGEYIEFIGSDDCFFNENVVENIVGKIDENSDLISTNVIYLDEETHIELTGKHSMFNFCGVKYPWIQMGGLFIKKEILLGKGIDSTYRIAADLKLILQCVMDKSVNIQYLDDISIYFSSGGVSSNESSENELMRICEELELSYKRETISLKRVVVELLKKLNIYCFVKRLVCNYKVHKCSNSWCRWCGRNEVD